MVFLMALALAPAAQRYASPTSSYRLTGATSAASRSASFRIVK